MPETIELYTTEGCHLCEQAEALCAQAGVDPTKIEIAGDVKLMEIYGLRIPVLKQAGNQKELGWPFDAMKLKAWLVQT